MNCDELRDHYELYTMGLAEEPEDGEIRAHLGRDCPTCVPGVRRARELMALLGATAPPVQPPARLRQRVLAAVADQPARRWHWAPVWIGIAAAAVIAALFFNARERRADAELARVQAESASRAQELARLNEALAILNQPDARQVVFGAGAPQPPRGRVFLDPQRGVLLLASNLPPAPEGKAYEMWVIPKSGNPAPAGLFQSATDGTALHVLSGPVDVTATGAIAVTLEPAGGVPQPTTKPVIVAAL
jgi:anti-sigma-K factor RskA